MTAKIRPVVLAIDDEPMHNFILDYVLKHFGAEPLLTTSSDEFLSHLTKTTPALCLIDLNISFLGEGYKLVQKIREKYKESVPIIVVSQKFDKQAIAQAIELGADDFITKPLDKDLLAWKLKRFLKTEELSATASEFFPVPEGGSIAAVQLDTSIEEVDELGIKLASNHLPLKGTTVHLEGPAISEITGINGPLPFMVTSTWLSSDGKSYGIYVEFDSENEKLLDSVRKWIFRHSQEKAAKNKKV